MEKKEIYNDLLNANKKKSIIRADKLKEKIHDYLKAVHNIPTGYGEWDKIIERQKEIRSYFNVSIEKWKNWEWQIENRITRISVLMELLSLTSEEVNEIEKTGLIYRWAVSPYYLSLIEPGKYNNPVRLQSVPALLELDNSCGVMDPMDEQNTSPAPAITRRYPDRLIVNITNQCAMYCRHCQRRRNIGESDFNTSLVDLKEALDYIRHNSEIRDVLLTGGDALMLQNKDLDWLLTELNRIPHVEIKRLGTRVPVTLPYRIDDELCEIFSRHLPLYINTQFNHPLEITPDSGEACLKLARSGVALGNQTVLLKGINNDPFIIRKLNQELLKIMVRPYYIFHALEVKGTSHFRTRVEEGIEIMDKLRGFTSGLAVPTYIINAPGGYGKTPVLAPYILASYPEKIMIRTWEKQIMEYDNR